MAAINEEEGIACTLSELKIYLKNPRIIVVDGQSTDQTVNIAKNMGAEIVVQHGIGKGDAIAEGIKHLGSNQSSKYVVITDADYTYPSKYVPIMIEALENNPEIGMVCGNRFCSAGNLNNMKNIFYAGNKLLAFSHNLLNGITLEDPLTGLRVLRWEILNGWVPRSKGFDIEVELNHHVERKGFGILEVPIDYRARLGEKKLKARHGLDIMRRIVIETTY